jgi:hypothetical protein
MIVFLAAFDVGPPAMASPPCLVPLCLALFFVSFSQPALLALQDSPFPFP